MPACLEPLPERRHTLFFLSPLSLDAITGGVPERVPCLGGELASREVVEIRGGLPGGNPRDVEGRRHPHRQDSQMGRGRWPRPAWTPRRLSASCLSKGARPGGGGDGGLLAICRGHVHRVGGVQPPLRLCAGGSVGPGEKGLPLFDDVRCELSRVAAADVLHRVDRFCGGCPRDRPP